MIVVMADGATESNLDAVVSLVESSGVQAFVSRGAERVIVGLVGDVELCSADSLRAPPRRRSGRTVRISVQHKLVSREHYARRSIVYVDGQPIGPGGVTLIAGPCTVETPEQTLAAALMAKEAGATLLRGGAFKPRTSPYAFQGLEEQDLKILAEVREEVGLPLVTEVVDTADVDLVASYADMLQIGTRNMQNFPLLNAVGAVGKPVLLKRGMSATIEDG
jgi:3-deoxy-7-phosphoheptulonate synthase